MATKTTRPAATNELAPKPERKMTARFPGAAEPEKAAAMANMALRPSVNAAAVVVSYANPLGEQDLGSLVDSPSASIDDLQAGDMKRAEAMLYGQAHALQAIFMNLARRAASQAHLKQWEAHLRMAMKAQNQCRMTLETLATIKNPPVVFARQANINNGGQQQVNNGIPEPAENCAVRASAHAHAGKSSIKQSKLLEAPNGERLNFETKGKASRAHRRMATVGAIKRPQDRGR